MHLHANFSHQSERISKDKKVQMNISCSSEISIWYRSIQIVVMLMFLSNNAFSKIKGIYWLVNVFRTTLKMFMEILNKKQIVYFSFVSNIINVKRIYKIYGCRY